MENDSDLKQRYVTLQLKETAVHCKLPQDYFDRIRVETHHDYRTRDVFISMIIKLMGRMITQERTEPIAATDTEKITEQIPLTAWDAVKSWLFGVRIIGRIFSSVLKPVKFRDLMLTTITKTTKVTEHWHLAPLGGECRYQNFVMWGSPFEGSMEEFVAMKKVVDALEFDWHKLNGPAAHAMMDYVVAKGKMSNAH